MDFFGTGQYCQLALQFPVRVGLKGKTMEGKGGPKRSTHGRQR